MKNLELAPMEPISVDLHEADMTEGMVDPRQVQKIKLESGKFINIGKHIKGELKERYINLLKQYKDVFAWSHKDLKGTHPWLGEHRIDLNEGAVPVRQR